ncbi:TetR family transcriptional regulator [Candidatus Mycosynbacter amalyticus]|uniref:TetR family transcriptional regulator n=1 Tax=Candidatus Mycosynbacter amalyticus TaxID=2665156 RepID=A0A857MKM8_9BACT|nr:TetR/AcrR family transcriptional regulator [Candidatus Mycosynbacter amalyticus]QHN42305.1 TetR family transcriptional regulator [Candidatus Mycosynbacter amalyticus]
MTTVISNRLHPDERKDQLLAVAAKHFADHGYTNASMSHIATEAHVGRALVYHYYPSKAALFEAVILHQSDELLAATKPTHELTAEQNLVRALNAYIDYQERTDNVILTLRRSDASVPKTARRAVSCHHDVHTERIIEYLNLPDTPLMRGALSSWLSFVAEMAYHANEHRDIAKDHIIRICINALENIVGSVTGNTIE